MSGLLRRKCPPCCEPGEEMQACCLPDGTCQDVTAAECRALGGIPQGAGTLCINTICPPPGKATECPVCIPKTQTCEELVPNTILISFSGVSATRLSDDFTCGGGNGSFISTFLCAGKIEPHQCGWSSSGEPDVVGDSDCGGTFQFDATFTGLGCGIDPATGLTVWSVSTGFICSCEPPAPPFIQIGIAWPHPQLGLRVPPFGAYGPPITSLPAIFDVSGSCVVSP